MKVRILLAIVLIALLAGCRAKKVVIDESNLTSLVDTTKSVADSLTVSQTTTTTVSATDTTKTATTTEENTVIDFVDGGGTVSIDTAGNMTITGVKSIKGNLKQQQTTQKGTSQTKQTDISNDVTQTHNEQSNGIQSTEQRQSHQQTEINTVRPKCYQNILAKIGGLCCIAAILWALFLYLKKKL